MTSARCGAVPAVFLVDVLDHLFAALVLEIDVDVGRLVRSAHDESARTIRSLRSDRPR